jgi:hypothetical protein
MPCPFALSCRHHLLCQLFFAILLRVQQYPIFFFLLERKEKYYHNNRDMCLTGTFALPIKLKGRSTAAIMVMATNGATSANCF